MELAMRPSKHMATNGPATTRHPSLLRRFGSDRKGIAAIEFALLAGPFFAIVLAILETSIIFLGELTLDHAVERAGRLVRTNDMLVPTSDGKATRPMTEAEFREEICEKVDFLFNCEDLKVDLRTYAKFSDIPTDLTMKDGKEEYPEGYTVPGVATISALRVHYEWPLYTDMMRRAFSRLPDGSHHLIVGMAAFRTEP